MMEICNFSNYICLKQIQRKLPESRLINFLIIIIIIEYE